VATISKNNANPETTIVAPIQLLSLPLAKKELDIRQFTTKSTIKNAINLSICTRNDAYV